MIRDAIRRLFEAFRLTDPVPVPSTRVRSMDIEVSSRPRGVKPLEARNRSVVMARFEPTPVVKRRVFVRPDDELVGYATSDEELQLLNQFLGRIGGDP